MLNRRHFEALHQAIDSRLDLLGLPRCRVVGASYISQTCLRCGARDVRNAHNPDDMRLFLCVHCGYQADVDTVAAHNVARKLIWLRMRRTEKAANVPESERTPWEVFARDFSLTSGISSSGISGISGRQEGGESSIAVEALREVRGV